MECLQLPPLKEVFLHQHSNFQMEGEIAEVI